MMFNGAGLDNLKGEKICPRQVIWPSSSFSPRNFILGWAGVAVDSKHDVRARFFERGVGETQSSGTGSCASAVAAMATGRAMSPVKVHAPGGTQTVRTNGNKVFLRGTARLVCRGEFFVS
jgi:diaminopimelate epimerase